MSSAHSPTFPSLHLRHNSFSNPSVALPTSQLIPQLFRCFTYVTAHSPNLLSLPLRHRLFTYVTWRDSHDFHTRYTYILQTVRASKLSFTSPTSQLILKPFRRFTYVTAHSSTLQMLHLCHSSFSNTSVPLPTSQLILPPFRSFNCVTAHSLNLLSLFLRHRLFTYVTWRAAHANRLTMLEFCTVCIFKV